MYQYVFSVNMINSMEVVPAVTWPRRISLIRLMKWPWWSRKLAPCNIFDSDKVSISWTIMSTEYNNNFHAVILRQHRREVLKNLRAAENIIEKLARWKNHRIFNIRCLRAGIMPRSIQLSSVVKGTKAETTLHKVERTLLDIRIRQCTFTIPKLEQDLVKKKWTSTRGNPRACRHNEAWRHGFSWKETRPRFRGHKM